MPAESARRDHAILLAQHQLDGHRGVGQLQQPRLQQRLDEQLEVGRAVRGVVDDADSSRSLTPSGDALSGRVASRRLNGSCSVRWPNNRANARSGMPEMNLAITSNLTGLQRVQPPAAPMPVTLRARPRRSSSNATQPPSELPTM